MTRQATEDSWKERVAQWRNSGLSQRAFADKHGYQVRQVRYWVQRLVVSTPPAAQVPVVVKQGPLAPATVLRGPRGWSIEVPAGTPIGYLTCCAACNAAADRFCLAGHRGGRYPGRRRPPVAPCATSVGPSAQRWHGLRFQQPPPHPLESGVLGRQRRLDVCAAPAPRPVRLAAIGRHRLGTDQRAMAMAGVGRGLATPVGAAAGSVEIVNRPLLT
jgi:hypothetical protein